MEDVFFPSTRGDFEVHYDFWGSSGVCNLSWMVSSLVLFVSGVDIGHVFCLEQSVIGSLVIHLSCLLSIYYPTKVGPYQSYMELELRPLQESAL